MPIGQSNHGIDPQAAVENIAAMTAFIRAFSTRMRRALRQEGTER
jgi:hypothetical protein